VIFLNPWALVGLLAVAGPIAAHLLGRRQARRLAFPNLRFLPATVPSPVSRDRISDVALLVLRIAIVAAAAIALAQPVWVSPDRARQLGNQLARAVIVDTSASMSRPSAATGAGGRALDVARQRAAEAAGATISRIVEAEEPASTIPAAVTWLLAQPMRRELTIVSDFQTSALTSADVERVPAGIGVRLVQVPAAGPVPPATSRDRSEPLHPTSQREVALLAGAADRGRAVAARAAAIAAGAPAQGADTRPTAIVFAGFETRADLLRRAHPLNESWMSESFSRVAADALVVAAAARAGRLPLEVLDARSDPDEPGRLLVFVDAAPHSLLAAAVIHGVLREVALDPAPGESATTTYSNDDLRRWERPASDVSATDSSRGQSWSDARWVWLAVLFLLLAESLVRRRRRAVAEAERHALVA
jgi:hypothetical protein